MANNFQMPTTCASHKVFLYISILIALQFPLHAQEYFSLGGFNVHAFDIDASNNCTSTPIADWPNPAVSGMTMTPDGGLYFLTEGIFSEDRIYRMDIATGNYDLVFTLPYYPNYSYVGLVAINNDIFYTQSPDSFLIRIDLSTNTSVQLGPLNFKLYEICLFEGEIYFVHHDINENPLSIRRLNVTDPANSELVVEISGIDDVIGGITASHMCNTLVMLSSLPFPYELHYINLLDGSIIDVCVPNPTQLQITSMNEFEVPICGVYLDLDEDDSSGATDVNFNSDPYTCLNTTVHIADDDVVIVSDDEIGSMTIELTGFVPDDPLEILNMAIDIPAIDVIGNNTNAITLINAGGATVEQFKEALREIYYINDTPIPTAGERTVVVQFTTAAGSTSNEATAFIEVLTLPDVEVDLGPDITVCPDVLVALNAGNPGSTYEWSSGESTQVIEVNGEGMYSVTVTKPGHCPGIDTVELVHLPAFNVSLTGDDAQCEGEIVTLSVSTDIDFPVDFEISVTPGGPLSFADVVGSFTFQHSLLGNTFFEITNIASSNELCLATFDSTHAIEAYATYMHDVVHVICDGHNIEIDGEEYDEEGLYVIPLTSAQGCDSVIMLTLIVVDPPEFPTHLFLTDCNVVDTGTTFEYHTGLGGCDSVVITHVQYITPDTNHVLAWTCDPSMVGMSQELLLDGSGCDSLVVTDVQLVSPDTTYISGTSCDSSATGTFISILQNEQGCDSTIIATITWAKSDTTYLFNQTCDPATSGVFETLLQTNAGCDSLVINSVVLIETDTTFIHDTSCDPGSTGIFQNLLTNQFGCDSLVLTTIIFAAADSTYQYETSCDPTMIGTEISLLTNTEGCDSVLFLITTLSPGDTIILNSSSCHAQDTGLFEQILTGQDGCDSVVFQIVEWLPGAHTLLQSTTCIASEAGEFNLIYTDQQGCDSLVTLTVELVHQDTTRLTAFTCNLHEVGTAEFHFTATSGCDSLVIEETLLYDLPEISLAISADYNGAAISCTGASDGSLTATMIGIEPYAFAWSTGSTANSITGLSAGQYSITVTDGNGCSSSSVIELTAPEPVVVSLEISQPDCFEQSDGVINVIASGGVEPYLFGINGSPLNPSHEFEDLAGGPYTITTTDANGCAVEDIVLINVPLTVNVEVGDDTEIAIGDTVMIMAIVNVPYDSLASVIWSGLQSPACPTCLTQIVAPIITTTYSVQVTSHDGCIDSDQLTLTLKADSDIFIPNVFTPNGDGINDFIGISTSDGIKAIQAFYIYDRWGNLVFGRQNLLPDDPSLQWDGTFRNEPMDPAVFAYKAIIRLNNGSEVIRYGDVTLLR
jgi:gliding motility-associated-like protein